LGQRDTGSVLVGKGAILFQAVGRSHQEKERSRPDNQDRAKAIIEAMESIEANDWTLTPGRYVGVAPEEEDENFDFEETLREIDVKLEGLNAEAVQLAEKIRKNFQELGIWMPYLQAASRCHPSWN